MERVVYAGHGVSDSLQYLPCLMMLVATLHVCPFDDFLHVLYRVAANLKVFSLPLLNGFDTPDYLLLLQPALVYHPGKAAEDYDEEYKSAVKDAHLPTTGAGCTFRYDSLLQSLHGVREFAAAPSLL